jgi:putative ABC transport system permease protein
MGFLALKHFRRHRVRTATTILGVAACILLLSTLHTLLKAVDWNLRSASDRRLVTRHAVSLVFNLPLADRERIASVPGVVSVVPSVWFGGVLGNDRRNFFPNTAVQPAAFLAMYPELVLPPEQRSAFVEDRRGCIVGRKTAERFGWKLGDTFQLESFIPPYRVGKPFEFTLRGIYDADPRTPGTDLTEMFFHFEYLYEATAERSGVGTFLVGIEDPAAAARVGKAIDALFENADAQTRTETESAYRAGFLSMAGNLKRLLDLIGMAVVFAVFLVTANTMSMAVRERRREIAILKAVGFSNSRVVGLIVAEALAIGAAGGALGIVLGRGTIRALPSLPFIGAAVRGFPDLDMTAATGALGLGAAVAVSLAAALAPAVLAYRARVVEALR